MNELIEFATREAAGLIVTLLLPVLAAAAGSAIVAGWVGSALGVRDGMLGQCIRTVAVVLTLALVGEQLAATTTQYARAGWGSLADLHDEDESEDDPVEAEGEP